MSKSEALTGGVSRSVLAVDIGGTKVAAAVISDCAEIEALEISATSHLTPDESLDEILTAIAQFRHGRAVEACGIALPAILDSGVVTYAAHNIPDWQGVSIRRLAEERLGIPCVAEFDGYAAALGEFWAGRARGALDAAMLIVGTGVGGGIVHSGRLYRGRTAVAGGIGWMRLVAGDELSETLEDIASGPAIVSAARRGRPGEEDRYPNAEAVFAAAYARDPVAAAAVRRAVLSLGAAVGVLIDVLAPQIVVLGGGVGSRADVVAPVRELGLAAAQPAARNLVRIEPAELGRLSSLYGAAYLAHLALQGKEP